MRCTQCAVLCVCVCVCVRAVLYPGLSVYCLLLTASPVLQSICSGVREILFCTSVLVEQSVCVHPLFVLYCIVYYKRVCVCVCVCVFHKGPPCLDLLDGLVHKKLFFFQF